MLLDILYIMVNYKERIKKKTKKNLQTEIQKMDNHRFQLYS